MKYLGRLALLFLLAVKAYATVTVTIDVSGITGGNLPGSSIVIALQHCATARVVGTGQIVPQSQTVFPHFGASTITLFDNTQINCSGQIVSYYSFSFIYQGVTTQIGSYNLPPGIYQLGNLTPCTGTACYGPSPAATPVIQIIAGSNITISPTTGVGAVTVNSSAGGLNQLTGDVTAGPGTGSQATTLATVNSGSGACGDATHVCVVTTNPKGLVTSQTTAAIAAGSVGSVNQVQVAGSSAGSFAATPGVTYFSSGTSGANSNGFQLQATGSPIPSYLLSIIGIQGAFTGNTFYNGTNWITAATGSVAAIRNITSGATGAVQISVGATQSAGGIFGMDAAGLAQWTEYNGGGPRTWFNSQAPTPAFPTNAALVLNPSANWFVDYSGNTTTHNLTMTGTCTGCGITALTGDVTASGTGSVAATVARINGTSLAGLATGILKNTTTTGVPSIAAAGTDYVSPSGLTATLASPPAIGGTTPAAGSFTTLTATGSISTGGTPPTACGSATGCMALTEASTAGTPTASQAYIRADSTSHTFKSSINNSSEVTLTQTIASGTSALGASAIASGACASVVTATATGTATTDVVSWSFNGDVTAVTGYAPVTTGGVSIYAYPTANTFNAKVCNPTSASITPGAVTLNWRVVR